MKRFYKWFIILIFAQLLTVNGFAQKVMHNYNIDVLHYNITLEIFDFTNQAIKGNTELIVKPKIDNLQSIDIDLLAFFIDSIN